MKTTKAVTYPVCDTCDREIRTPDDGILVKGAIYAGGPVGDYGPASKSVLVGTHLRPPPPGPPPPVPFDEHEDPPPPPRDVPTTAVCWDCFNKKVKPPVLKELKELEKARERQYSTEVARERGKTPSDW
jgi:hypothetical protein